MDTLIAFYGQHPMWEWLAVAAVLLAIEVATGSGWLLPAAASAAAVGVLTLVLPLGFPGEAILFAVLAVASTFLSRRFLKSRHEADTDEDVNDQRLRLVGRSGEAVQDFVDGRGRVFVDGSEWSAEAEPSAALAAGARVEVTGLASGARTRRQRNQSAFEAAAGGAALFFRRCHEPRARARRLVRSTSRKRSALSMSSLVSSRTEILNPVAGAARRGEGESRR